MLLAGCGVGGDAAAVVLDPDRAVGLQGEHDPVAVAGQRLVDGVVDDLPDQVVQAALAGGTDVHARPLADRLETLEDLDRGGVVLPVGGGCGGCSAAAVGGLDGVSSDTHTSSRRAGGRGRTPVAHSRVATREPRPEVHDTAQGPQATYAAPWKGGSVDKWGPQRPGGLSERPAGGPWGPVRPPGLRTAGQLAAGRGQP